MTRSSNPSKYQVSSERWQSNLGIVLAVASSAVGIGNFLRFPGVAANHGGGAFMLPYLCALLLLGIPLGWAEWTMGRYGGVAGYHSAPAILGYVGRSRTALYLGSLGVLVPLAVYTYYVLIETFCLHYALLFMSGKATLAGTPEEMRGASRALFERVTGYGQDGSALASPTVFTLGLVVLANFAILSRKLARGIELLAKWAMPLMALCAVVVLVRVLTLGAPNPAMPERDVWHGLGFMWNPEPQKLMEVSTWIAATGQVFFTLSVGFGVILNYASYLQHDEDVVLSGLAASATNELFEVGFGGLITVPAAFIFLGASGLAGGTFGIGFQTLPIVFAHMGNAGRFLGALWFFMLFLAAITSSLSMLQPVKAFLQESVGMPAPRATALLGILSTGGAVTVLGMSHDFIVLETLDFWVGTLGLLALAGLQCVLFCFVLGVDRGLAEAARGARMSLPRATRFVLKYVAPIYLGTLLVSFCVQELPAQLSHLSKHPRALAALFAVACTLAGIVVLIRFGISHKSTREGAIPQVAPEGERP